MHAFSIDDNAWGRLRRNVVCGTTEYPAFHRGSFGNCDLDQSNVSWTFKEAESSDQASCSWQVLGVLLCWGSLRLTQLWQGPWSSYVECREGSGKPIHVDMP